MFFCIPFPEKLVKYFFCIFSCLFSRGFMVPRVCPGIRCQSRQGFHTLEELEKKDVA